MAKIPPLANPTVDAIWRAREAEHAAKPAYDGYGISASELGQECERRLFYSLRWASMPEDLKGRTLRIFERGDIEEERVVADLRRAGVTVHDVDPETGNQWRFAMARGFLRGKADGRCVGVLEAPKAEHVLEIKSMKAADWRAIQKHGLKAKKPEHWHQLHSGMAGLDIERGLYVAVNKDTEEILVERLRLDREEAALMEGKVLRLLDMHEAPLKIRDDGDGFPCRFCKHVSICQEGAFSRRTCRSCIHFTFTSDGNGHCERFNEPRRPDAQKQGCPAHLYLPTLVHGEQIDANPEAETITYRLASGGEWIDGESRAHSEGGS